MKNKTPPCWVVIPAAGTGSRMENATPKQYLSLANKLCLQHVLDKFLSFSEVQGICVTLSPSDTRFIQDIRSDQRVFTTMGGATRSDSVLNALRFITHSGAKENGWVLVHDAARPCVEPLRIQALLHTCEQKKMAGLLAVPVADTIKKQTPDLLVEKTVDRQGLWQAQTPQCARLGVLREALARLKREGLSLTDEASALEATGQEVVLVKDSRANMKITLPEDLWLAEKILESQKIAI